MKEAYQPDLDKSNWCPEDYNMSFLMLGIFPGDPLIAKDVFPNKE